MPATVKFPLTSVVAVAVATTALATALPVAGWENVIRRGTWYALVPGVRPCRVSVPVSEAPEVVAVGVDAWPKVAVGLAVLVGGGTGVMLAVLVGVGEAEGVLLG